MRSADVDARGERREDRVEPLDRLVGAADHQAVAALEAEDAAAGAAVDVVDPALGELAGAADVVAVVGVAAVDDRVAGLERSASSLTVLSVISPAGTITQAARGVVELGDEVVERVGAGRALAGQRSRPRRG